MDSGGPGVLGPDVPNPVVGSSPDSDSVCSPKMVVKTVHGLEQRIRTTFKDKLVVISQTVQVGVLK